MEDLKKVFNDVVAKKISKNEALNALQKIKNKGAIDAGETAANQDADRSFSRTFRYGEPYLKDHTVFKEQVLLGVTHCSLAINAFYEKYSNLNLSHIHRMLFIDPIILKENEETEVIVEITEQNNKKMFKNLYRKNKQGELLPTASGEYVVTEKKVQEKIDVKGFIKKSDKKIKGEDLYSKQSDESIKHGPSLKTVKEVFFKGDEILGELIVTDEIESSTPAYRVHPALFDGAIMSALSFRSDDSLANESYVPFMIKEVYLYAEGAKQCYCYSKVVTLNKEVMVCDIKLCDKEGNLIAFLEGFTCKRVESANIFGRDSVMNNEENKQQNTGARPVEKTTADQKPVAVQSGNISDVIEQYLFQKFGEAVGGNVKLSKNQNFMDMGIDSNQLLVVAQEMEKEVGIELYPTIFFEQQNIQELTEYFSTEHKSEFSEYAHITDVPDTTQDNGTTAATVTTVTQAVDTGNIAAHIEKYLFQKFGGAVGAGVSVNKNQNFMDMGIDSNQLLVVAQEMEKEVGIELYPTIFFEQQNIEELTEYFSKEFNSEFVGYLNIHTAKQVSANQAATPVQQTSGQSNDYFEQLKNKLNSPVSQTQRQEVTIDNENMFKEDIAIIGMSGVFADSQDLDMFWDNIKNKKNMIKEVPLDHFDYRPWFDTNQHAIDKTYSKWGSFIDDVDMFDASFFNISPKEAELMDPQLRYLLQHLYATAEDAGRINDIKGSNTGMYVGICFYDFMNEMHRHQKEVSPYDGTGNAPTMYSNRPSFYFNLHGPSVTIDTACSSSLVALHMAVRALQYKECDMAYVAGINLLLGSWHYRYFSAIGALSPTGRCHTFDERADGYVPGEAIATVLLKPLSKAIEDNDQIHAVIKGTAINHGGYTPAVTAPSAKQEAEVILKAWDDANIDPQTISYIEAHGTGTKLGDPIEINALKNAFKKKQVKDDKFCAIGSTKAHIGHAEGAAGVTGIIKVILSMKNQQIPAMPMFEKQNAYIDLNKSPLYINRELQKWDVPSNIPRRAGISSFGFGGTYAHVVVEEFQNANTGNGQNAASPNIFTLSAKNKDRLKENVKRLLDFIERKERSKEVVLDQDQMREEFKKNIIGIIAQALKINDADVDTGSQMEELGIDHVQQADLVSTINETYDIDLVPTFLAGCTSINEAIEQILEKHEDMIAAKYPGAAREVVSSDATGALSLDDIVYSLQVGRESMEERFAIIVSSLEDLKEGLQKYYNGEEDGIRFYTGNVASEHNNGIRLIDGRAGEEFLRIVCQDRDFDKIAQLWISGIDINWELLYADRSKPRRISLPTYSFEKKRYWPEYDKNNVTAQTKKDGAKKVLTGSTQDIVINIIAEQTGYGNEAFDKAETLDDFGIDSITQIQIVSSIINTFEFLKSDVDGDLLLQCSSLKELVEFIDSKKQPEPETATKKNKNTSKKERKIKEKPLDTINTKDKKKKENLMSSSIMLVGEDPLEVKGKLLIDESHPFFFDHPLDHISGMHLTEAMNEVAKTAYRYSSKDTEFSKKFISDIRVSFDNFCKKEEADIILNERKDKNIAYNVQLLQGDQIVTKADYQLTDVHNTIGKNEIDTLVKREACDKGIVNKTHKENVLISQVESSKDGEELKCWLLPLKENSFFDDFSGDYIDIIVLLESCRQGFRAFTKFMQEQQTLSVFDNDNVMGILRSQSISLKEPIYKHQIVSFHKKILDNIQVGKNRILNISGDIYVNNTNNGSFKVEALLINRDVYATWRKDDIKAQFKS